MTNVNQAEFEGKVAIVTGAASGIGIKKVMPLLHSQAHNIEEETGIESSLTDEEAKQHLEDVLAEVRGSKKSR